MTLASRCGVTRTARRAAIAMGLLTGLAAGVFALTWGTQVYGLTERVLLDLGMGWITRARHQSVGDKRTQCRRRLTCVTKSSNSGQR
jgi:hypothetical protein